MSETSLVFDKKTISYSGLFSSDDLYHLIDKWLKDNGYTKDEITTREKVGENGRYVYLLEKPNKKINDYLKILIQIEVEINNLVDVEITTKDKKTITNKGDITINFMGFVVSDYEGKWESKPQKFAIRVLFDRFIFKSINSKAEEDLKKDIKNLMTEIRSFLGISNLK